MKPSQVRAGLLLLGLTGAAFAIAAAWAPLLGVPAAVCALGAAVVGYRESRDVHLLIEPHDWRPSSDGDGSLERVFSSRETGGRRHAVVTMQTATGAWETVITYVEFADDGGCRVTVGIDRPRMRVDFHR